MYLLVFCAVASRLPFKPSTRLYTGYHCIREVRGLAGVVGTAAVAWVAFVTVLMHVACTAPLIYGRGEVGVHSHPGERQERPSR
jgi:hypothetical protein